MPERRSSSETIPEARVVREAFDTVLRRWRSLRVERVIHTLHYGAVVAEGGALGLYYTHAWEKPGPVERLVGESLSYSWRILASLESTLAERAAAWGAVAAATNEWISETPGAVEAGVDEAERLGLYDAEAVAMIGYIEPLAARLAERGVRIVAFDRNPAARAWGRCGKSPTPVLPDTYAPPMLRNGGFDAVLVSGSALAHPGAAPLLADAAREGGAKVVALLGPSASIHPWICARLGYTHVASSHPPRETREKLMDMVSRGYGYRRLKKLLVKYVAECRVS